MVHDNKSTVYRWYYLTESSEGTHKQPNGKTSLIESDSLDTYRLL